MSAPAAPAAVVYCPTWLDASGNQLCFDADVRAGMSADAADAIQRDQAMRIIGNMRPAGVVPVAVGATDAEGRSDVTFPTPVYRGSIGVPRTGRRFVCFLLSGPAWDRARAEDAELSARGMARHGERYRAEVRP